MLKEYHVVCGEIARNNLIESNVVDFSIQNNDLIFLNDNLNLGKLFDLKSLKGIEDRIQWFEDFYKEKDSYYDRYNHSKQILARLKEITSCDTVVLWLGDDGNEYIWKAAVLNFLQPINTSVYTVDWKNIPFDNGFNVDAKLFSLYVCTLENIQLAKQYIRLLTEDEKLFFSDIWDKLLNNNADFRVLNNQNEIEESDITYFDDLLIAQCGSEPQLSFKVIGLTLGAMYNGFNSNGIGDMFLIERLKQLCYEGKLLMINQEHGQRNGNIFEVALKN